MSSEVKANKWSPGTGVAGTLGDSGDTFTVPSGATLDVSSATMTGFTIPSGQTLTVASGGTITNSGTATGFGDDNTPAFLARLSAAQSIANATWVKLQIDTEKLDTAGAYDNSTNYRFTVSKAGIYFIYSNVVLSDSVNERAIATFKVNGTHTGRMETYSNVSGADPNLYSAFSKNLSVNDYVEVFVTTVSGGATARSQNFETYFGAYRIGA